MASDGERGEGQKDGFEEAAGHLGRDVRLTVDTEIDSCEQAIAAVQAAYGLRPDVPADWLDAPASEPRLGPDDLGEDDLRDGWTDRLQFQMALFSRSCREVTSSSP
ncbi:hypothetical protein [Streptomyces sp. NPDC012510]|uniref:hypothetical protein n=1 Tax=Streptomyces sp. NPDC012510 TaxID=3364838 RepID=UPI0036E7CEC2